MEKAIKYLLKVPGILRISMKVIKLLLEATKLVVLETNSKTDDEKVLPIIEKINSVIAQIDEILKKLGL